MSKPVVGPPLKVTLTHECTACKHRDEINVVAAVMLGLAPPEPAIKPVTVEDVERLRRGLVVAP